MWPQGRALKNNIFERASSNSYKNFCFQNSFLSIQKTFIYPSDDLFSNI